jgi:hypothetical protein
MVRPDVIASHVETLLERMLGADHLPQDVDREWSVRSGTAMYTVRVKDQPNPNVEVFSVALDGVRPTRALYERLNEFNLHAAHSRWFVEGRRVIVAGELVGETLDPEELVSTCNEVATSADQGGQQLHESFGGALRFPADGVAARGSSANEESTGGYL